MDPSSDRTTDQLESAEREALLDGLPERRDEEELPWERYQFHPGSRKLSPGELARLWQTHQRFASAATDQLTILLRERVRLSLVDVSTSDYREFTRGLPQPAGLYLVHAEEWNTSFVLQIAPRLLLALIDHLLGNGAGSPPPEGVAEPSEPAKPGAPPAEGDPGEGGQASNSPRPAASPLDDAPSGEDHEEPPAPSVWSRPQPCRGADRPLTPLEDAVSKSVVAPILKALGETWRPGAGLALQVVERESNPLLLTLETHSDSFLVATFSLVLGKLDEELHLALPQAFVLGYLRELPHRRPLGSVTPDQGESPVYPRLKSLDVPLSAELTTQPFTLRSLLSMQPGDLIDTGHSTSAPVRLRLGQNVVARGVLGAHEGKLAVRIVGAAHG